MPIDENTGISIASLIGLVVLFLINKYKPEGIKSLTGAFVAFKDEILQRLTRVETTQSIYVEQWKDHLADTLHSENDEFGLDCYFEKMKAKTISKEETCIFRDKIKGVITKLPKTDSRRYGFIQLLAILEMEIPNWK